MLDTHNGTASRASECFQVKTLLGAGACVNATDSVSRTPLHAAAIAGQANTPSENNALILSGLRNAEATSLLLKAGADTAALDNRVCLACGSGSDFNCCRTCRLLIGPS